MRSKEDFPEIIDLMGEFWSFFEQTRRTSRSEEIQLFRNRIVQPNIACYSSIFGISDDGLRQYIAEVGPKVKVLRSNQDRVLHLFRNTFRTFRAAFPEFQADFVAHLLPSLKLFQATAIPSQGKTMLVLGIDALSELTDNHCKGYLTHELFHLYHFQRAPAVKSAAELALKTMKMPPLWGLLWTEGLACHAVRVVNPEIPDEEILDWRPLLDETRPLLPELASEARRILTDDSPESISGYFYFPRKEGLRIPTGCGYYIGMLVAGSLAQRYPIDRLIFLEDDVLIREIDSALLELQGRAKAEISDERRAT